jgi:hypothetical protein
MQYQKNELLASCLKSYPVNLIKSSVIGCVLLLIVSSGVAIAQRRVTTNVDTYVPINRYVPKELPLSLGDSSLMRTIKGNLLLDFVATNTSSERISTIQFLAMVVDEKGNVKFGQGWRSNKVLEGLSSTRVEIDFKYPVANGDKLVLFPYHVVGKTNVYEVLPGSVLNELVSKGQIKNKTFVHAIGVKLTDDNPCAAAQTAAAAACRCGLKSFSCNPQTGEYSFTCFSQQENPSACPEGPPDN